jgi:hypothetical protein
MRVKFALHCQVVGMDGEIFKEILSDEYSDPNITWQVAVQMMHPTLVVLLFADHNKLAQYLIIAKVISTANDGCC